MKNHWDQLALREKQVVSASVVLIILLVIYFLLWNPLNNEIHSLKNTIVDRQQTLLWMKINSHQIQLLETTLQKQSLASHQRNVFGVIQKQIAKTPFSHQLTQLQQQDGRSVHMTFQQVDFDLFIGWLVQLWEEEGITVNQISITPAGNRIGSVNVDATL